MPINVKQKQAKSANPFFFGFISDTEMNMYTGETPVNYSISAECNYNIHSLIHYSPVNKVKHFPTVTKLDASF